MRMLQVCNVGRIAGGTAACAWTITRALPGIEHQVAFLSDIGAETRRAFAHCRIHRARTIDRPLVAAADPDVVLLHNVAPGRVTSLECPAIQYMHSAGRRAAADVTIACSSWLAQQCGLHGDACVLYQAVPKPPRPALGERRALRRQLVVGRLCTPTAQKWPPETVDFYRRLAQSCPGVRWEFVGCPPAMQGELETACRGAAMFWPASWSARDRLWTWDALLYHHPTLTESFGRTAAESMRAGCIPIVDCRGGFIEQIPSGAGFLCADLSSFQRAVQSLTDPGARQAMSRAAMSHADRAFSLDRFRRDLLELLRTTAECSIAAG